MQPTAHPERPLVAVVGPTAMGKSALAVHLARRFGGEVVNADSRQVYRGMEVGTGVPTAKERSGVPHHLYAFRDPAGGFSLAEFLSLASRTLEEVHQRGRVPILAGGTGQYVWALLEGWRPPPVPPDPALRRLLEACAREHGPGAIHRRLQGVDPESAARIDPRNVRRTIRALEVHQATGIPFSRARARVAPPYRSLVLGLATGGSRPDLYLRVDRRLEGMLAAGWLEEVRRLLEQGVSPGAPAMGSIGYRELALHLAGQVALEEAVGLVRAAHHRLARRQQGWFSQEDPRIRWLVAGEDLEEEASALVGAFLRGEG